MSVRTGVLAAVFVAMLATAGRASADTPIPRVTGPLPVSAGSYPFGAADHQLVPQDLGRRGYVEEEYLVSGEANVYEWPASGPAVVRTPDAPYTTRVLVRRPAQADAVQRQRHRRDAQPVEPVRPEHRLGAVARAVHAQRRRLGRASPPSRVAVAALKTFDPQRYGSLSFANPLPLDDPRNCTNTRPSSTRRRCVARHRGRAGVGHLQPGRRVAAQRRPVQPAGLRPGAGARAGSSTPTASATRRPAATWSTTSTRSTRSWSGPTAGRSTTATSSPWRAAHSSAPYRSTSAAGAARRTIRAGSSRTSACR